MNKVSSPDSTNYGGGGGSSHNNVHSDVKEQIYQDKLAELKLQLRQLHDGVLPDYLKRLRRLEATFKERARVNTVVRDLEIDGNAPLPEAARQWIESNGDVSLVIELDTRLL